MNHVQGMQVSTPECVSACHVHHKESSGTSQTCLPQSIPATLCEEGGHYQKRQKKQIQGSKKLKVSHLPMNQWDPGNLGGVGSKIIQEGCQNNNQGLEYIE